MKFKSVKEDEKDRDMDVKISIEPNNEETTFSLDTSGDIKDIPVKEITFETVGEFVKTEKYLKPEDCEFSKADYKEDKSK